MSEIVSFFFRPSVPTTSVVGALEKALNIEFRNETDNEMARYIWESLGIRFILFNDHGLTDDMGIHFTRYSWEMDIEVNRNYVDSGTADSFQRYLCLYLFSRLTSQLGWETIAVVNLQRIIAKQDRPV